MTKMNVVDEEDFIWVFPPDRLVLKSAKLLKSWEIRGKVWLVAKRERASQINLIHKISKMFTLVKKARKGALNIKPQKSYFIFVLKASQ